ncbi:MAG: DUF1570 domain-containing protein [Planctomycetota bacterium]|nr:DUF1570 domain-containing protein [Planctomycetota bacterium]
MDTLSQNFIAYLYSQNKVSTDAVDACINYWKVQQRRGRSITLPEIVVERGLLSEAQARQIIKDIQQDDDKSSAKAAQSKRSKRRKGVPTAKPVTQEAPEAAAKKEIHPLVYVGAILLGIVLLYFVVQKLAKPPEKLTVPEQTFQGLGITGPSFVELERDAAEAFVKNRQFDEAREKLAGLLNKPETNAEDRQKIEFQLAELSRVEALVKKVQAVKKKLRGLLKNEDYKAAKKSIEDLLRNHPELKNQPEGGELEETLSLLSKTKKEDGGTKRDPSRTKKDWKKDPRRSSNNDRERFEVPASKLALSKAKAVESIRAGEFRTGLWEKRYKRAKQWVANEKKKLILLVRQEAARALKASKKTPLTARITKTYELTNAVVEKYDEDGFTLKNSRGEFGYRWDLAQRELAYKVRKLGVDEKSADSQFRFGKFCVKRQYFSAAKRAFRKAASLDGRYSSRVPDLAVLEKASKAFHGEVNRLGGELVGFKYPFQESTEQLDWVTTKFAPLFRKGQLLIPNGPNNSFHLIGLKGVVFHGFSRVTLDLGRTKGSVAVLMLFAENFGLQVTYYRDAGQISLYDLNARRDFTRPIRVSKGAKRLRMTYRGQRLEVQLDRKDVAAFELEGLDEFQVQFGGRGRGGQVALEEFRVEGRVSQVWLRKTFAEADDIIEALLADEGVGAPQSAWARKKEALSAESLVKSGRALRAIREARIIINDANKPLEQAQRILNKVIQSDPRNAVAYYERARVFYFANLLRYALFDLNRAVQLAGGFHEALAMRGRVLINLDRMEDARKDIERALEFRRDSAQGLLAKGTYLQRSLRNKEAEQELEIAYALWPKNSNISRLFGNLTHVVNGPPWERRHKVETDHYIVLSDISESRARFYADRLEWIHAFYQKQFPYSVGKKKATALIFNTQEGYQQYANLTRNSRAESTLGYFHPVYDQLLLFEDPEGSTEETLDTLYHEGFHQFISRICPSLPFWANEGLAEYFGPTRFDDYGTVKSTGALNPLRLPYLRDYKKRALPFLKFADLMNQSGRQFQSGNVGLKYAQSWSMIHFFKHGTQGRGPLFKAYFEMLRAGRTAEYAYKKTYGQLNLSGFENQWNSYLSEILRKTRRKR